MNYQIYIRLRQHRQKEFEISTYGAHIRGADAYYDAPLKLIAREFNCSRRWFLDYHQKHIDHQFYTHLKP